MISKTLKLAGLPLLAILFSGCAADETVLLKNDSGQVVKCEVTAGDARRNGYFLKERSIDRCVSAYEESGFKRVGQ